MPEPQRLDPAVEKLILQMRNDTPENRRRLVKTVLKIDDDDPEILDERFEQLHKLAEFDLSSPFNRWWNTPTSAAVGDPFAAPFPTDKRMAAPKDELSKMLISTVAQAGGPSTQVAGTFMAPGTTSENVLGNLFSLGVGKAVEAVPAASQFLNKGGIFKRGFKEALLGGATQAGENLLNEGQLDPASIGQAAKFSGIASGVTPRVLEFLFKIARPGTVPILDYAKSGRTSFNVDGEEISTEMLENSLKNPAIRDQIENQLGVDLSSIESIKQTFPDEFLDTLKSSSETARLGAAPAAPVLGSKKIPRLKPIPEAPEMDAGFAPIQITPGTEAVTETVAGSKALKELGKAEVDPLGRDLQSNLFSKIGSRGPALMGTSLVSEVVAGNPEAIRTAQALAHLDAAGLDTVDSILSQYQLKGNLQNFGRMKFKLDPTTGEKVLKDSYVKGVEELADKLSIDEGTASFMIDTAIRSGRGSGDRLKTMVESITKSKKPEIQELVKGSRIETDPIENIIEEAVPAKVEFDLARSRQMEERLAQRRALEQSKTDAKKKEISASNEYTRAQADAYNKRIDALNASKMKRYEEQMAVREAKKEVSPFSTSKSKIVQARDITKDVLRLGAPQEKSIEKFNDVISAINDPAVEREFRKNVLQDIVSQLRGKLTPGKVSEVTKQTVNRLRENRAFLDTVTEDPRITDQIIEYFENERIARTVAGATKQRTITNSLLRRSLGRTVSTQDETALDPTGFAQMFVSPTKEMAEGLPKLREAREATNNLLRMFGLTANK